MDEHTFRLTGPSRRPDDDSPDPSREEAERDSLAMFAIFATLVIALVLAGALGFLVLREGDAEPPAAPARPAAVDSPRVPPNSTYERTEVTDSGELRVTQVIRSDALLFNVGLSVPDLSEYGLAARAENVKVVVDDRVVPGPKAIDKFAEYPFVGAMNVEISYLLTGVVERSESSQGRALARVVALDVDYEPPPTTTIKVVEGSFVLSLACWGGRGDPVRPCGAPVDDGWGVRLTGDRIDQRVMAQLDIG